MLFIQRRNGIYFWMSLYKIRFAIFNAFPCLVPYCKQCNLVIIHIKKQFYRQILIVSPYENGRSFQEYGHILQHNLLRKRYEQLGWTSKGARKFIDESKKDRLQWYNNVLADFEKECKSEIIAIAKKNNPSFKLVNKISRYGKTSNYDFFAEVFANSQSSKPNELGLAMEQWLKEKGY